MKKSLILILAFALTLSLASCSEPEQRSVDTDPSPELIDTDAVDSADTTDTSDAVDTSSDTPEDAAVYEVVLDNGLTIVIGGDADEFIESTNEKYEYMEAPSCVHEGFDKVYTFDGYSVTTSPDADGNQYIAELSLLSDVVALESGLMIGGSADDAQAAFGAEYEEQFGVRTYTLEGAAASVILDGDTVTGITISCTRS